MQARSVIHFIGEMNTVLCGPIFHERKLVRDFSKIVGSGSLRFIANPL